MTMRHQLHHALCRYAIIMLFFYSSTHAPYLPCCFITHCSHSLRSCSLVMLFLCATLSCYLRYRYLSNSLYNFALLPHTQTNTNSNLARSNNSKPRHSITKCRNLASTSEASTSAATRTRKLLKKDTRKLWGHQISPEGTPSLKHCAQACNELGC